MPEGKSSFMSQTSRRKSRGAMASGMSIVLSFLAGLVFWGGFNWSLEFTNTEAFCISCHEMGDNVYPEYQQSIHFINPSGVRATCPDCHVPKQWTAKLLRKIGAVNELYHKVAGTIDTREKFLAKRLELARTVWKTMRANNSQACRNCHAIMAMSSTPPSTATTSEDALHPHQKAIGQVMACIDCHLGIAHRLPESFLDAEHDRFESEKVPCSDCHAGMAYTRAQQQWGW
ncbi:MAG: NapC/NirT family cytochrome c [Motiliproteus sp.]